MGVQLTRTKERDERFPGPRGAQVVGGRVGCGGGAALEVPTLEVPREVIVVGHPWVQDAKGRVQGRVHVFLGFVLLVLAAFARVSDEIHRWLSCS